MKHALTPFDLAQAFLFAGYSHAKAQTLATLGLGEQISSATDSERFPSIQLAIVLVSPMVVTMNRLVLRRLYGWRKPGIRSKGNEAPLHERQP